MPDASSIDAEKMVIRQAEAFRNHVERLFKGPSFRANCFEIIVSEC